MFKSHIVGFKAVAAIFSACLVTVTQVQAAVVQCGANTCSSDFEVTINGMHMGTGELIYDTVTGDITLNTDPNFINNPDFSDRGTISNGGIMWAMSNGTQAMVKSLSGNADPILGFGLGASTGGSGASFGFTFNLPISLSGTINANSSVSYSLSSLTASGAQITASGNVVTASELDTSVGGLGYLNKGVDVGDTFFFTSGPLTQNSPVYTASNTFTGNTAYDLMEVKVDFGLSANSNVGISGFVQQVVVPVPAAVWLFASGLLGLAGIARRKA